MKLSTSVLAFGLLFQVAGSLEATTCEKDDSAQDCLDDAFVHYCEDLVRADEDSADRLTACQHRQYRWLILDEVCNSPQLHKEFSLACDLFDEAKGKSPGVAPLALVFDHSKARWTGKGQLASPAVYKDRVKIDVAGQPRLSLGETERVELLVENTNPLFYSARAGTPTEKDVPELAQIKKLAGLLGTSIQALVKSKGAAGAVGGDLLDDYRQQIQAEIEKLAPLVAKLKGRLEQLDEQIQRAVFFVQQVELGREASYPLRPITFTHSDASNSCDDLSTKSVDDAFARLAEARRAIRASIVPCRTILNTAVSSLAVKKDDLEAVVAGAVQARPVFLEEAPSCKVSGPDGAGDGDLKVSLGKAIDIYDRAVEKLQLAWGELADREAELKAMAGGTPEAERLRKDIKAKEKEISGLAATVLARFGAASRQTLPKAKSALESTDQLETIFGQIDALLAKRGDARKAAAQLGLFEDRLEKAEIGRRVHCEDRAKSWKDNPCVPFSSLTSRLYLSPQVIDVRATKIQEHSVKVVVDSPWSKEIQPIRPAEVSGKFELDSVHRGMWGISASLIYTDLKNPVFGAVTDPGDAEKKVIGETDRETRAGEIALLADYRLGRRLWPDSRVGRRVGLEFGAGIAEPSLFLGISLRPVKAVRLGVGYTYQQVKDLRGQGLGDSVTSDDDIKKQDAFEGELYFSLSVALESISLFSAGD